MSSIEQRKFRVESTDQPRENQFYDPIEFNAAPSSKISFAALSQQIPPMPSLCPDNSKSSFAANQFSLSHLSLRREQCIFSEGMQQTAKKIQNSNPFSKEAEKVQEFRSSLQFPDQKPLEKCLDENMYHPLSRYLKEKQVTQWISESFANQTIDPDKLSEEVLKELKSFDAFNPGTRIKASKSIFTHTLSECTQEKIDQRILLQKDETITKGELLFNIWEMDSHLPLPTNPIDLHAEAREELIAVMNNVNVFASYLRTKEAIKKGTVQQFHEKFKEQFCFQDKNGPICNAVNKVADIYLNPSKDNDFSLGIQQSSDQKFRRASPEEIAKFKQARIEETVEAYKKIGIEESQIRQYLADLELIKGEEETSLSDTALNTKKTQFTKR